VLDWDYLKPAPEKGYLNSINMNIVSKFIPTHSMNIQNVTAFLDIVKKYKLLYESCGYDFLLVKENKQWTALCVTVRGRLCLDKDAATGFRILANFLLDSLSLQTL
jgi:hypothetical protein